MISQKAFLTIPVRNVLLKPEGLKLWDIFIYFQDIHATLHISFQKCIIDLIALLISLLRTK